MSVRSMARGVVYRLLRHPDSEVTMTARCMSGEGCWWELAATTDLDAAGVEILAHTAATGHGIFTRGVEDMAAVVLTNREEQARRVEVRRLEHAARERNADPALPRPAVLAAGVRRQPRLPSRP
ncbi:hypothetical protein AB0M57_29790 [Streptomyces sp. NPDC051597]|uniref:hypothetical protein n=1 Tax=Streptomyces sp. NPDC051597 TaxID=3155049 RepID=UPI003413D15D